MHRSLAAALLLAAAALPAAPAAPAAEAKLDLRVKLEKDRVALGDPIRLQCRLTSRSARALAVTKLRIGAPNALVFYVKGKDRPTRQVSRLWGHFQGNDFKEAPTERVPLKKGETLEETVELLAILQGEFEIRAIYLGGDRTAAPDPVEAKPVVVTVGPGPNGETRVGARVRTDKGDMIFELLPEKAFNTVHNFLLLAREGFYKDRLFHRVMKDFMAQTGCPKANGSSGPGYYIPAEFNDIKHEKGVISMAREQHDNTAGSQFFVMTGVNKGLDGRYTAFGRLVEGMPTVDALNATPVKPNLQGEPSDPLTKPKLLGVEPILLK
jgi:peptidyl-prolyl cis-trans isomerase B (cyclophilin B)